MSVAPSRQVVKLSSRDMCVALSSLSVEDLSVEDTELESWRHGATPSLAPSEAHPCVSCITDTESCSRTLGRRRVDVLARKNALGAAL